VPLHYFDQVVEIFDPETGLMLPERLAALVTLDQLVGGSFDEDPGARWRKTLATLLRDRGAPRLRTLILADWTDHAPDPCDIDFESGEATPLLRRHGGRLAALERLHIGRFPARSDHGFCMGIGAALTGLRALQRLELCGQRGWDLLPPAGHPQLCELIVDVEEHDDDVLAVLLTAPFPALTRLELRCGPDVVEALVDGSFAAAVAGGQFPRLERLTLRGPGEDEGASAVAGAAALRERGIAVVVAD
jgi:hypothetical protein